MDTAQVIKDLEAYISVLKDALAQYEQGVNHSTKQLQEKLKEVDVFFDERVVEIKQELDELAQAQLSQELQ